MAGAGQVGHPSVVGQGEERIEERAHLGAVHPQQATRGRTARAGGPAGGRAATRPATPAPSSAAGSAPRVDALAQRGGQRRRAAQRGGHGVARGRVHESRRGTGRRHRLHRAGAGPPIGIRTSSSREHLRRRRPPAAPADARAAAAAVAAQRSPAPRATSPPPGSGRRPGPSRRGTSAPARPPAARSATSSPSACSVPGGMGGGIEPGHDAVGVLDGHRLAACPSPGAAACPIASTTSRTSSGPSLGQQEAAAPREVLHPDGRAGHRQPAPPAARRSARWPMQAGVVEHRVRARGTVRACRPTTRTDGHETAAMRRQAERLQLVHPAAVGVRPDRGRLGRHQDGDQPGVGAGRRGRPARPGPRPPRDIGVTASPAPLEQRHPPEQLDHVRRLGARDRALGRRPRR